MSELRTVDLAARKAPVVSECDVLVVGGGPAGISAAVSAARGGADVILTERYPYLGGLATGGMVLVLDDMHCGTEITVRGIGLEIIDRMAKWNLAVFPPDSERDPAVAGSWEMWHKWSRWGLYDFRAQQRPNPVCFSAAFDPDGFKRASYDMIAEAGVRLRLQTWFTEAIVDGDKIIGVVNESKAGPEALLGKIVIDASGDLDVAASAGAPHVSGSYMLTTVSRIGGVDTEDAIRFQIEDPDAFAIADAGARKIIGSCWEHWWLKTPLPGVVWCNCPHMTGFDALSPEGLTGAEIEGRRRVYALVDYARAHIPGFKDCYVVDVAPQTGVRQTRLLEGEYVVSKDDVGKRRHFSDTVCRGRDYYTPYRALLPKRVDQLLVAGRHYSATPSAQKASREIPPCMAMGEAAGVAALVALDSDITVRNADVTEIQRRMRAQGADPGDQPSSNAQFLEAAE